VNPRRFYNMLLPWASSAIWGVIFIISVARGFRFTPFIAAAMAVASLPILRCPVRLNALTPYDGPYPHRCRRFRWHRGMHHAAWRRSVNWVGPE
jgi:hypothetical protein